MEHVRTNEQYEHSMEIIREAERSIALAKSMLEDPDHVHSKNLFRREHLTEIIGHIERVSRTLRRECIMYRIYTHEGKMTKEEAAELFHTYDNRLELEYVWIGGQKYLYQKLDIDDHDVMMLAGILDAVDGTEEICA